MRLIPFAACLAAVLSCTAQAEVGTPRDYIEPRARAISGEPREVNERRPLQAEARLSVRNLAGLIEVDAWDKAEMELMAQLGESVEGIDISGTAAELKVEVRNRRTKSYSGDEETRLQLRVPAGVILTLDGTSADVIVRGIKGAITARSVSGDMDLAVPARVISLQTVSGDVQLEAPAARETRLNTVSGDSNVQGASGVLVVESVSGDVTVEGGSFSLLELKSVSGDIAARAAGFVADAKVKAESLSGDVRVSAPDSLSAEVTMKSFSGERHCDFEGSQRVSDGKRTLIKVGAGRGQFSLTSFSGDVSLDRR